jgi:hypothetical protein
MNITSAWVQLPDLTHTGTLLVRQDALYSELSPLA